MADNSAYPGNPSLTREVREKVLSTFRHSLNLFKAGKRPDCAVGCDFILKMDPRFGPARQLLEMARNPAGGGDIAELEKYVSDVLTPQERVAAAAPDKLLIEAIEAYAARNFERAIENANKVLAVLPANSDAKEILAKAKRKLDVQPHVENFRQRALFALEAGQTAEAKLNFERMRSLDPEHPQVEMLARRIEGAGAGSGGSAGVRPPALPPPDFFRESPAGEPDIAFDVTGPAPPPVAPLSMGGAPSGAPPPPATLNDLSMDSLNLDSLPAAESAAAPAQPAPAGPAFFDAPPSGPEPTFESDLWSPGGPQADFASGPASAASGAPAPPEVERLLREGEELETRGDPQGAIETWSRIFLIDLNNAEAAARIERARSRMADSNRRVAEALKTGRSLYESGKLKEAREKFLEVLALDENEPTARSYLNRIEEDLARPSFDLSQQAAGSDVLSEEELPADTAQPRATRERPERARVGGSKPMNLLAVAGILVVAIAAGAFLLFRSKAGPPTPAASPAGAGSSIEEARRLFREGKTDEAREILEKITSTDPQFARAQKLLATFPASAASASAPASTATAAPASAPPTNAAGLRTEAEAALSQHRYIDALKSFNLCASAFTTDEAFRQEMSRAGLKVQEISSAVKLYNDGDYDTATPILWRMYQSDHDNFDVRSYLVRSYYNQGVNALQADLYDKAYDAFKEALGVDSADPLALRQRAFAERYSRHSPDLLAKIYVKYLRPRP